MVDLYADMFELAPVSLWLEDYSELKALFEQWRAEGVEDLRAFLADDPERIAACSRRIKVLRVNACTLKLYGARDQQHLVDHLHLLFRDDMLSAYVEELVQLWNGRLRLSSQTVNYTLQGERMVMVFNASVLPGHEARWDRVLVALEDVSQRERSERHARSLFEHSPVSLWRADFSAVRELLDGVEARAPGDLHALVVRHPELVDRGLRAVRILDVNRRALGLFGAPDKATLLARLGTVFRHDMHGAFAAALADLSRGLLTHQREAAMQTLGGRAVHVVLQCSVLPGHEARWDQVLISMTDITARKEAEAALAYLGTHDALTGLRNRSFFHDEIARLERVHETSLTLLVIDVDGLKQLNDTRGHAAGDDLLRLAARLLDQASDAPMSASRIGGDEFVLLMPGSDEADGQRLIDRLRDGIARSPPGADGVPLSLSIGAATRLPGESVAALLQRADARMYLAKRATYEASGRDRRAG
jgi:diguanylate cyclase (GGDEF)-like protein